MPPYPASFCMTLITLSASRGSKYSRSEVSKSVDTVSGLELIITLFTPASDSAQAACTEQ